MRASENRRSRTAGHGRRGATATVLVTAAAGVLLGSGGASAAVSPAPMAPSTTETGSCTPPTCSYGQWPTAAWRPYSADSVFNNALTGAVIADRTDSAAIVTDLPTIHRTGSGPRSVPAGRRAPGNIAGRVGGEGGGAHLYSTTDPHTPKV